MGTTVATRKRRQPSPAKAAALEARKTAIETAAEQVDRDAPDFRAFLALWGDRYNVNNLARLWVQCPGATQLHKFPTWQGMGRQVRAGQKAILLQQPRVSYDEGRVTPDNPKGEKFHGASWMALFDYSQTADIEGYDPAADLADANPELVAEVKRLRAEAIASHPDMGGDTEDFKVKWAAYEAAKARLEGPA